MSLANLRRTICWLFTPRARRRRQHFCLARWEQKPLLSHHSARVCIPPYISPRRRKTVFLLDIWWTWGRGIRNLWRCLCWQNDIHTITADCSLVQVAIGGRKIWAHTHKIWISGLLQTPCPALRDCLHVTPKKWCLWANFNPTIKNIFGKGGI